MAIRAYNSKLFDDDEYSAICRYVTGWAKPHLKSANPLTEDEYRWCKTVHQLVRLMIDDVVFENRHKTCGGTGFYQARLCRGCNGSGRKMISVNEQARRLNVSTHNYSTHWQDLFDRFVPMLHEWEHTVLRHLQRKLYDAKEQELVRELSMVR